MDNPWANAWNSEDTSQSEADIAAPSWNTWNNQEPAPIWPPTQSTRDEPWQPSPYESFTLTKPAQEQEPQETDEEEEVEEEDVKEEEERKEEAVESSEEEEEHADREQVRIPTPILEPPSPDGFGGFEAVLEAAPLDDPWTPAVATFEESNWQDTATDTEPDEWEAARIQKERQDRHVPPERLAEIVKQFEDLSSELYPAQNTDADESNWRTGVESVPGMDALIARFVPENMTLESSGPFAQSFTAKRTTEAIKLTRNIPFTRSSPLGQYVASKGSTAWEVSVKSRPELVTDDTDVIPAGWRILEKKEENETPAESPKRPSGGLLSFFGRRSSTQITQTPSHVRATSESPGPTRGSISASVASSRTSIDVKPPSVVSLEATVPLPSSGVNSPVASNFPSTSSLPLPTTTESPDVFPQATPALEEPQQQPTSAVSRFLNRFSRSKSSSPRHSSVALSSDDLEFLSDIVPSATDDDDQEAKDHQLRALQNMITSAPLPDKLPPPLAPPPKMAPPPKINHPTLASTRSPSIPAAFDLAPVGQAVKLTVAEQPIKSDMFDFAPLSPTSSLKSTSSGVASKSAEPELKLGGLDFSPISPVETKNSSPLSTHPPITNVDPFPSFSAFEEPPKPTLAPAPAPAPLDNMGVFSFPPPPARVSTPLSPPRLTLAPPVSRPETPKQAPKIKRAPIKAVMTSSSASSSSSSLNFSFPPPPMSTNQPMQALAKPPQPTQSLFGDDDDFTDFTSARTTTRPTAETSFVSATSQDSMFSLESANNDGFDDFDDFVTAGPTVSEIQTPSPPRPPVKAPMRIAVLPPPSSEALPQPAAKSLHKRTGSRVSEHEHRRTQSLLNDAAERGGSWLGPPTPLPEVLPPPVGQSLFTSQSSKAKLSGMNANLLDDDLFGGDAAGDAAGSESKMEQQQKQAMASLSPFMVPASHSNPAIHSNGKGAGGLSAQDLSFFEGL